jgi:hypothetical protein
VQFNGECLVSADSILAQSLLRRLRPLQLLALCTASAAILAQLADGFSAAGLWPAAALCGLLLWAALGEQLPGSGANLRYVGALLVLGAGLRATRLHGAALGVECYAAATLAGQRRNPTPWCSARSVTA